MTMTITLSHYLVVGALLFALGLVTVATRRNAVGVLMGVELILNGANVNFVAFERFVGGGAAQVTGFVFALFVIVLAAAEAAVGLAIVLALFQTSKSIDVRQADLLRE